MSPCNDHEHEIAGITDRIAAEGQFNLASIQDIVNCIDFLMSSEDSQFLMNFKHTVNENNPVTAFS